MSERLKYDVVSRLNPDPEWRTIEFVTERGARFGRVLLRGWEEGPGSRCAVTKDRAAEIIQKACQEGLIVQTWVMGGPES